MTKRRDATATARTWSLDIEVPLAVHDAFELAFDGLGFAVSSYEHPETKAWYFQVLSFEKPDATDIDQRMTSAARALGIKCPVARVTQVPQRDWVSHTNRLNAPVHAGRFFLFGAHDAGRAPVGSVPLQVEAGLAFGTGRAPSTFGCLIAIDALAKQRRLGGYALDLGCGSAVLAMAAARSGAGSVIAADIDPIAVRVADENVRHNGLRRRVRCLVSTGFRHRQIGKGHRFNLIIANILSRPLARLGPDMRRHVATHGYLVLSGLLGRDQWEILPRYRALGFRLVRRIEREGWTTLVFRFA